MPIRARPADWFFVIAFACFAFTSCFSDAVVARGVPLTPDSPSFWARANYWYANGTDPMLIQLPIALRVQVVISALVFGPFYLLLVYAFLGGKDWIRIPALLYVSAMTYGMILLFGTEFFGGSPPTNVSKFLAFNLPYLIVPLMLGYRMRRPHPFT